MKSGICLTSETGQADCATIEVQPDWFVPVIVCVDVDSSTTIRGFTIAGSYFPVGAMGCHNSSPTITNVTFTDNYGGALYCVGSSPTLQDVAFLENWDYNPGYGGCGMYCEDSSVTLTDCRFVANEDHGMMCLDSSVTLTDCTFLGNAGPGMSCGGSSVLLATGCEFAENAGQGCPAEARRFSSPRGASSQRMPDEAPSSTAPRTVTTPSRTAGSWRTPEVG